MSEVGAIGGDLGKVCVREFGIVDIENIVRGMDYKSLESSTTRAKARGQTS